MNFRLAACALIVVAGCGYQTGSMLPEGVKSIALMTASNDTFYREDELVYTRRLGAELVRGAKVKLRDKRDADAILECRIVRMPRATLVEGRQDVILDDAIVGVVEVVLRDKRSGREIDRFEVRRRADAIIPRGENLETSRAELAELLAKDTVVELERRSFLLERGYGGVETRKVTMIEEPK